MKTGTVCLLAVGCLAAACRSTTHWKTPPPAIPRTLQEFDVAWSRVDDNGCPLNPVSLIVSALPVFLSARQEARI